MAAPVKSVVQPEDFSDLLENSKNGKLVVIHFEADWAPQCQQMNDIIEELIKDSTYKNTVFAKLSAEALPAITQQYKIVSVPSFLFLISGKEVFKLEGANVPEFTNAVKKLNEKAGFPSCIPAPKEDLNVRLKKIINSAPCMLFIKGSKQEPKCGFSKQAVELLNSYNTDYRTFDILGDEEVRQGLKEYSKWPTYPQLYLNGELIGGIDIMKELKENDELDAMLPKVEDLNQKLEKLVKKAPVMVFMKGSPETPRCGFSRTLVSILNESKVPYFTFDILEDDEVRQGLKEFSKWPTYPQVYVNGSLIGGLDIIKELKEGGELEAALKG